MPDYEQHDMPNFKKREKITVDGEKQQWAKFQFANTPSTEWIKDLTSSYWKKKIEQLNITFAPDLTPHEDDEPIFEDNRIFIPANKSEESDITFMALKYGVTSANNNAKERYESKIRKETEAERKRREKAEDNKKIDDIMSGR